MYQKTGSSPGMSTCLVTGQSLRQTAVHWRQRTYQRNKNSEKYCLELIDSGIHFQKATHRVTPTRLASRRDNREGEPDDKGTKDSMDPELKLLIDLIVEYPATRGTIAAVLGYLVHVNPLSSLHWSQYDITLGLLFALPIFFWDALIMVPNWDAPKEEKKMRLTVPRSVAERLGETILSETTEEVKTDINVTRAAFINIPVSEESDTMEISENKEMKEQMVIVERTLKVRGQQSAWRDALRRTQVDRAMNNAGQLLHPASEALLLFLVHFSEEMLYRGFGLSFAVKWTTDRLYEATGEDALVMFNGAYEIPIPTVGAWVASISLVTVAIYLLLSRDLKSLKVIENLDKDTDGRLDGPSKTLIDMKETIINQQKWNIGITAISEIVQWSSATIAFLYTGNLLAPIAGALASDAMCSYWQRNKLHVIQDTLLADSRERLALAKQSGALVEAMKEDSYRQKDDDDHDQDHG